MFSLFKTYISPTYKEIINQGGVKKRRASDVEAIFLFLVYVFACLISSTYYRLRHPFLFRNIDPDFTAYKDTFDFWQLTGNWHKVLEGYFFRKVDLNSPSLEIGFYRGNVSALHFEGKTFDFGSEYVYQMGREAKNNFKLWDHLFCDELTALAVKDNSAETVCLVHIVDHLENLEPAFSELARVIRSGGRLHFSGYCENALRPNIWWRILGLFSSEAANRYSDELSERLKLWNFLSCEEWEEVLEKHGFRLVEFHYMGANGLYPYLYYFLHFFTFYKGCFENEFFQKGPFAKFFKPLFHFFYVSIGYPVFVRMKQGRQGWSTDFFITAEKF
jgi:SAM-dependent methyltransferase